MDYAQACGRIGERNEAYRTGHYTQQAPRARVAAPGTVDAAPHMPRTNIFRLRAPYVRSRSSRGYAGCTGARGY
jgi:hypothetical protein